jgi:VWFA-related protein
MKRLLSSILFLLCASSLGLGQTPKPTVTPNSDTEDVVKISTDLIQLDVTVTDRDGKIVTNLKPEDFEIFENNERQSITNFSFISSNPTARIENLTELQSKTKNSLPPIPLKPEQVRRTIALVVDDLTLSRASIMSVRQALRKFVDEQMQDGDLVAVILLSNGNSAVQQFTSDKNFLRAAIKQIRWYFMSSGGSDAFIEPGDLKTGQQGGSGGATAIDSIQNSSQSVRDFQAKIYSSGTLGSLNYLVGGMKDLPGRKSIMFFSDGFKLVTETRDGLLAEEPLVTWDTTSIKEAIQQIAETANRSSVIIYTIDARGLQPAAGVDDALIRPGGLHPDIMRGRMLYETQQGLGELAEQTGGFMFANNNDLPGGIRKVLEAQTGYYLLAYVPDSDTFDPKKLRFNKLTVKVKRPGLNVRYRNGFFGVPDENLPVAKQTPAQQIAAALKSPFGTKGIDLRLNTLFASDVQTGAFVNSILYINAKDLQFTNEPDGSHKATIDVLAVSFGEENKVVDQFYQPYAITLKGETYQKILRDGLLYNFVFPIKKAGFYQLRVGLRDAASEKIGSANQFIEVPDIKAGRLTLSGIILENLSLQEFQNTQQGIALKTPEPKSASLLDTSQRRFKQGTVLRYGYEIYNAKAGASQKPELTAQIRMFRDGVLLFEGKQTPLDSTGQATQKIPGSGALNLGSVMTPGDYVLQIVVTDNLSKEKNKIASQFVQFEIVE